jgi:mRNA deadenylase 3'-5' endonuclease subunit Ccr4
MLTFISLIPLISSCNNVPVIHIDSTADEYTTWKSRSGKEVKHFIDYIFFTHRSLRVSRVLGPPASNEIQESQHKLPDLRYPSDHISIAADMTIIQYNGP